jgi:hexokinase
MQDNVDAHQVAIPPEVYTGPGTGLFDFLARELAAFMTTHGGCSASRAGRLPVVGFCFSFPMNQTAIDAGVLLDWTKGFTCEGVFL